MKTPATSLAACRSAVRTDSRPLGRGSKKKPATAAGDLLAELMQEMAVRDLSRRSDARQLRSRLS